MSVTLFPVDHLFRNFTDIASLLEDFFDFFSVSAYLLNESFEQGVQANVQCYSFIVWGKLASKERVERREQL